MALPEKSSQKINLGRLNSLGVSSPELLPFLIPRKYIDLRHDQLISHYTNLPAGANVVLKGKLTGYEVFRNSVPSRVVARLSDDEGKVAAAAFFGDPRVVLPLLEKKHNSSIYMIGVADYYKNDLQIKNPSIIDDKLIGRVAPIYPGKPRVISPETVSAYMEELLPITIPMAASWLRRKLDLNEEQERAKLSVMDSYSTVNSFEDLLETIHSPSTIKEGLLAEKLLKLIGTYDVLSGARAEAYRAPNHQSSIKLPIELIDQLLSETDLIPTDEQKSVIYEICADISSDTPMLRLLSADVGFGKTYVAAAAGAAVIRFGGTVVWLCPNQPLAVQTRDNIANWWPDLKPGLVIGDSADVIPDSKFFIGTTALHHRLPARFYPDLFVVDESQKFGSAQKNAFVGPCTNFLNVTATCIPRTAALMEYGGMAVSRLTKAHVQKEIKTRIVHLQNREKLFESIKRNVLAGHQALIIYPLAETKDAELVDRKSAEGAYELWSRNFPGRVRFMHGKLKDQDKLDAITAMRNDEADILIATTAIEVGIDIPRLRHVVIVHPERLGLNNLHQIRGRASRRGGLGRCDLFLPSKISEDSQKRLEILVKHADGFDVATENMKLQGFGDLGTDGTDQSGKKSLSFIPGHTLDYKEIEWVAERWLKS